MADDKLGKHVCMTPVRQEANFLNVERTPTNQ